MILRLTLAAAAFSLTAAAAHAQMPQGQRLTGTVKSVDAAHVVLSAASGDVDLAITPQTRILVRQKASAADIKAGAYLGTANVTDPSGAGQATEVHMMADGPNVHSVMDESKHLVMTNGHVKSVATTAKGQEMDVDYGAAATQHVVVPAGAPVTRLAPADISAVKPGETIAALGVPGADGKLTAAFIAIEGAK